MNRHEMLGKWKTFRKESPEIAGLLLGLMLGSLSTVIMLALMR